MATPPKSYSKTLTQIFVTGVILSIANFVLIILGIHYTSKGILKDQVLYDHSVFAINVCIVNIITWIPFLIGILRKWSNTVVSYSLSVIPWIICSTGLLICMLVEASDEKDPEEGRLQLFIPSIIVSVLLLLNITVFIVVIIEWKLILQLLNPQKKLKWMDIFLKNLKTDTTGRGLTTATHTGITDGEGKRHESTVELKPDAFKTVDEKEESNAVK